MDKGETGVSREIKMTAGELEVRARLNETNTATRLWEIPPISARVNLWGEEIYFSIPLDTGLEDEQEIVALGDIAYWPPGKAMCIFFGRTPVSKGEEIRPLSPVNVIGRIEGEPKLLVKVKQGEKITIEME